MAISSTVTASDTTTEPRQPSRVEKKMNTPLGTTQPPTERLLVGEDADRQRKEHETEDDVQARNATPSNPSAGVHRDAEPVVTLPVRTVRPERVIRVVVGVHSRQHAGPGLAGNASSAGRSRGTVIHSRGERVF